MKKFLLIAGSNYYPSSGTGDWVGCFETREDAKDVVEEILYHDYFSRGKRKGQIKSTHKTYKVSGSNFDWIKIVNLDHWIG